MYQERQAKWKAQRKLFTKPLHFHLLYESDTKLNAVLSPEFPRSGIPQKLHIKYQFSVSPSLSIPPAHYDQD